MYQLNLKSDWCNKTIAGLVLGYTLALAATTLFSWFTFDDSPHNVHAQVHLWIIIPTWLATITASNLFKSGIQAWYFLSSANVAVYFLLLITKQIAI